MPLLMSESFFLCNLKIFHYLKRSKKTLLSSSEKLRSIQSIEKFADKRTIAGIVST